MNKTHLDNKIIHLLKNKKCKYVATKSGSTHIDKSLLGKHVFFYNGIKWLCQKIDHKFYLDKSIGSFKKLNTKVFSVYKRKKRKNKSKKKK